MKAASWLAIWLTLNILTTLSNKQILYNFPFPIALSAAHLAVSSAIAFLAGGDTSVTPTRREWAFSLLFVSNIGLGNVALHGGSLALVQTVRSANPLLLLCLGLVCGWGSVGTPTRLREHWKREMLLVVLAVFGIGLMYSGETSGLPGTDETLDKSKSASNGQLVLRPSPFVTVGGATVEPSFALVLAVLSLGVSVAKALATHRILQEKSSAMSLLRRVGPLACAEMVLLSLLFERGTMLAWRSSKSHYYGEGRESANVSANEANFYLILAVMFNCALAAALNWANFRAIHAVGPLVIALGGNLKHALTIAAGHVLFGTPLPASQLAGAAVVAGAVILHTSFGQLQTGLPVRMK